MQQHMLTMESQLRQYQTQLTEMMLRMEKMEQKSIQDASELQHTKEQLAKARAKDNARVTTTADTQQEIHTTAEALKHVAKQSQEVMKDAAESLRLQANSDRITTTTQSHKHKLMGQSMNSSSDSDRCV